MDVELDYITPSKTIKSGTTSNSSTHEDLGIRKFYFNLPTVEQSFMGNKISTGKYNFFTFLPLFLFEQFRKTFNIFFLIICVLQQIDGVSPTGRFTTIVPLIFILLVAAIKEIIEDYKRHRQDDAINHRVVEVFRNRKFTELMWTEVVVGDVVRVVDGKFFPADLILLSSSEPQGMCYIETANLDGETNLKIRQAVPATSRVKSSDDLHNLSGFIECEAPNRHLYDFTGNISLKGDCERFIPLNNNQMLLRGALLRNTQWVYGIVTYTGHESKLMKNANRPPLKMSNVDRTTNMQIWILMIMLVVMSVLSAVGSDIWKKLPDWRWYLNGNGTGARGFILELLTFIILYNNLVPISLLVTLEVIKFIQASFINSDVDMYYEATDTPAMARTSNLNEELGQVKYIFTDKTGTLTQNHMVFKKCSVAGVKYRHECDEIYSHNDDFDERLLDSLESTRHIRDFVVVMALCHTVVPERKQKRASAEASSREDPTFSHHDIKYQSSSPDEGAIVIAAKKLGVVFIERTPTHVTIDVLGKKESYEILNVLEFSSSRKRMSVIVRSPGGSIVLFCKGADDVIKERLAPDPKFLYETENHLHDFAREGLRTLCFASTELDEKIYERWNSEIYYPASIAVKDREEKLAAAYEEIEKSLTLLGATAIEDKLQVGVPEAIVTLQKAEINIWMLTGDKQETAINIARSCGLVTESMTPVIFDEESTDSIRSKLNETLDEKIGRDNIRRENDFALVVRGTTLKHMLHCDLKSSFLDLVLSCKAVVCCRASPIEKAEIVNLVKNECKKITLAIGDGANDVSMIQAAHVGVGISGCEGLQAANSSDYSIAQFRYLEKLLLVHGFWNYTRLTKCILFSFYKNICLYMIGLWFAFYNGFSGQILFDKWTISFYNIFFTSLPPLTLGLFERPCSSRSIMRNPQLYSMSQSATKYNWKVFCLMIINAIVHSLLLFFIPLLMLKYDIAFRDGKTGGYLFMGNFVYTYVVVTVCLKAGLESSTWTIFTHVAVWGSILAWFIFFFLYSHVFPTFPVGEQMVGMADNVLGCALFWLGLLFLPVVVLFRDFLWKVVRLRFRKSVVEEVQELEMKNIDPSPTILQAARQSLNETAQLLKNAFGMSGRGASTEPHQSNSCARQAGSVSSLPGTSTGYAFSQEERGVVSQSELIRQYDSGAKKPSGK